MAPKDGSFDPAKPDAHKIPSKPYDIWRWPDGAKLGFHLKYKSSRFRRAVAEALVYLAHNEIPDSMVPFYNEPGRSHSFFRSFSHSFFRADSSHSSSFDGQV